MLHHFAHNPIHNLPAIYLLSLAQWDERRPVALVTSGPAWEAVREHLRLRVAWRGSPRQATLSHWQDMLEGLQGEVVYAVGGGLAADAAKFLAAQRNLPLVCIPTALSVDAFFTWASGIREGGCVRYIETRPPRPAVGGPGRDRGGATASSGRWHLRRALHCHRVVGLALRRRAGPEPARDGPHGVGCGGRARDSSGSAGLRRSGRREDPDGLLSLIQCLALEVLLCNLVGHSRPEEGSEHYFAYAVEEEVGPGRPHAELVGPGILLMARAQGQETAPLERALRACHVPLDAIPQEMVEQTLKRLPDYAARHRLPFGIAHVLGAER